MPKKLDTPPLPRIKPLTTKRKLEDAKDLWLEFYITAVDRLTPDDEPITESRAKGIAQQAQSIADEALAVAEERFPGVW